MSGDPVQTETTMTELPELEHKLSKTKTHKSDRLQAEKDDVVKSTEKKAKRRKHRESNLLHKKKHSEDATRSHKFRTGTVALRQIKHLQKSIKHQIPRQALKRVVKEIIFDQNPKIRLKRKALDNLHAMTENYVVGVFNNAQLFAIHSKRLGVRKRDYELAVHFRKEAELKGAF
jgi:histone H3